MDVKNNNIVKNPQKIENHTEQGTSYGCQVISQWYWITVSLIVS